MTGSDALPWGITWLHYKRSRKLQWRGKAQETAAVETLQGVRRLLQSPESAGVKAQEVGRSENSSPGRNAWKRPCPRRGETTKDQLERSVEKDKLKAGNAGKQNNSHSGRQGSAQLKLGWSLCEFVFYFWKSRGLSGARTELGLGFRGLICT